MDRDDQALVLFERRTRLVDAVPSFHEPDIDAAIDGATLLNDVYEFLGRFVAYPSEAGQVAHTLWIAHTHLMGVWDSTPRIAFLSPEPGSGKSRALEVSELLVPNPVHAINVSSAYLFRKVGDNGEKPTILFDEIDAVFGPKARENEDIRGLLNAGHRRGVKTGRCVVRGKQIDTEEIEAYSAVALAGLNDLPDTIMSRSIVVRMRRRAPNESVEPFRWVDHSPNGHEIRQRLVSWTKSLIRPIPRCSMPQGIEDRNADIWEPLIRVADAAGGIWPENARVSAVSLVSHSKEMNLQTMGTQLLHDIRFVFGEANAMFTDTLLRSLNILDESPWGDIRGKALDARGLARRLRDYEIKPQQIRIGSETGKGYLREGFHDAWIRYLPSLPHTAETPETGETKTDKS